MNSQKIYETLIQTIKGMFPHYKLPEVPLAKISILLNGPDGVLLLVIVIGFFIISNETIRVLIINLALAISAKVKEVNYCSNLSNFFSERCLNHDNARRDLFLFSV